MKDENDSPLKPQEDKLISEPKVMKDIKDYLHFYLPAGIGVYVFPDESITNGFLDRYKQLYPSGEYAPVLTSKNYNHFLKSGYKPVLRPLSDMTEDERRHYDKTKRLEHTPVVNVWVDSPESFRWLLSKGFDIFNLIPEGLAIDKAKLNSQTNEK